MWESTTDIQGRSQTWYTAPCNGVVSGGAQIGGIQVFADHTRKTNASTIFARRAVFQRMFISSSSECSRCRWHMHLTNHGYFDNGKTLNTPNLSPVPGSEWGRSWNLPCVSVEPTDTGRSLGVWRGLIILSRVKWAGWCWGLWESTKVRVCDWGVGRGLTILSGRVRVSIGRSAIFKGKNAPQILKNIEKKNAI